MDEFFTWTFLGTFAGAVTATAIITQWIKEWLKRIPTQIVSYIIALIINGLTTAANSSVDWSVWAIIPFNAVLVSLSANGAFSAVQRLKEGK